MSASRASRLYRAFRERKPTRARKFDLPKAYAVLGTVDAIEYTTTHGQKAKLYRHDFAPGSKPLMGAAPGKGFIVLIGRFRATVRGIVDLTARGREIED